jgi:serine/threonine protein kinase/Leucine-rich repeat (LRR) protein
MGVGLPCEKTSSFLNVYFQLAFRSSLIHPAAMPAPQTEVLITVDGVERARHVVAPGDYVIGRNEECRLRVDADHVSQQHAKLIVNYDNALIEDMGSDSGTFINDQPVKERERIWPSQKIRVGSAVVTLRRLRGEPPSDGSLAPAQRTLRDMLPAEILREKKYDIGAVVARGGMGAILGAREAAIERRVAMKVMLDTNDADAITRFVAEAKVTGQLEHPNIVPVHELGVDENGQPFYTMKLVRGITLKHVLEELAEGAEGGAKKHPLAVLLTIFQKVCDAVAFAHSKHVIHRDLKPENIMLGDYGEVLVMDWGLAKVLHTGDGIPATIDVRQPDRPASFIHHPSSSGTLSGTVLGTPQYMAPEQARGEIGTMDHRADIYALGAILYHILALRPPVSGKDAWEVVGKSGRGDIEPLESTRTKSRRRKKGGGSGGAVENGAAIQPDNDRAEPSQATQPGIQLRPHLPAGRIPESLAAVVKKAMAFAPADRYATVGDLQADILAYQNGFATGAENAGLGRQLVLLIKRNKGIFGTVAVAWILITALAAWFVMNVTRAKKQAEDERNIATRERDRAESTLTELRGTAPTFAEQAKTLVESGRLDDAMAKLGYAIELDPKNPAYRLRRAHLLEAGQQLAAAAAAYREVLALDRANRSARENLALCERLQKENGDGGTLRRELQLHLVNALLREGRAAEAGPLAAQLGENSEAIEAALRTRLNEYAGQPGWRQERVRRLLDGTFQVQLDHLKLGDLSVLRGMPVSWLSLNTTDFRDLTLLAGLPLKTLDVSSTQVSDLSPLLGLQLESLNVDDTFVADFEPLRGMPLRILRAKRTQATDASALAGMPLEELNLHGVRIKSLGPLRGMPLRRVDLAGVYGDADMAIFSDCRELEEIVLSSGAGNVESLRALPRLARLRFDPFQPTLLPAEKFWATFTPAMEATGTINVYAKKHGITVPGKRVAARQNDGTVDVDLSHSKVTDLGFLRGLPVSKLTIDETKVRDLEPLRGMPLTYLRAFGTGITDIEPLRGLPLTYINLRGTNVASVAPLKDCPALEAIALPPRARDAETLRSLPNLRLISTKADSLNFLPDKTAEEFWKECDAQNAAGKK